jgi:hypothetical protein
MVAELVDRAQHQDLGRSSMIIAIDPLLRELLWIAFAFRSVRSLTTRFDHERTLFGL